MTTTSLHPLSSGFTPGTVFDGEIPDRLVDGLAKLAGKGGASGRTGINNNIPSAFEGWDGSGWPKTYFDQVAAAQNQLVVEWRRLVCRLAMTTINGLLDIEPAQSRSGREFGLAVVRETTAGIDWHFDDAHLEYPGSELDRGPSSREYSIITYLNTPLEAGELEVADWLPANNGAHPTESYPLDERRFRDAERFRVRPIRGRTALLSSGYAHRVLPTRGPRKFITMFITVSSNGQAISFG